MSEPDFSTDHFADLTPEARARIEEARAARQQAAPTWDTARVTDGVMRAIANGEGSSKDARGRRGFLRESLRGGIASAVLVSGAILLVVGLISHRHSRPPFATASLVRTYTTRRGQQATITLPNGTLARLAPATQLSVVTTLSGTNVNVYIIGQAVFTVTPKSNHPFLVYTSRAVARVLGTTFLVRQYPTDRATRVVVTQGRVSLSSRHGTAMGHAWRVLPERTLGTVNDSGQVHVAPTIAIEEYLGWTRGQLVFQKTPVRDIVLELGRAYGVDIRVADSTLAARAITWTVPVTQRSLTGVLDFLAIMLEAHPVRTGHAILLVPGASPTGRPTTPHTPYSSAESRYGR